MVGHGQWSDMDNGRCWCETSSDFDLLVELIAHVLADTETSVVRVAHHQAVARQRQKLVADFGVAMHIAWTRHMLDNRELVVGGGTHPPAVSVAPCWKKACASRARGSGLLSSCSSAPAPSC